MLVIELTVDSVCVVCTCSLRMSLGHPQQVAVPSFQACAIIRTLFEAFCRCVGPAAAPSSGRAPFETPIPEPEAEDEEEDVTILGFWGAIGTLPLMTLRLHYMLSVVIWP